MLSWNDIPYYGHLRGNVHTLQLREREDVTPGVCADTAMRLP